MAIFKCKICGGSLEIKTGESIATCEYCGTKQTLPRLDDERKANLYDRANHFRRNNDYDKAMGIYETILNEDTTDAEAYWSILLCKYGIEYVEDPVNHKHLPTVNRAQYTSIFDDEDYKSALQYADSSQREIYETEAEEINEIQKGILDISAKEEPFDVFICYKETDASGRRTKDSVLATELYHELTRDGFKVFFSRITLEDKLGTAYEPYIFAALNSAKVMVVVGTKPEHFNAVWVRNEWSRYLSLIKNGAKKTLIPAYRDMDPYDLPEEFSHLQAQDMSKLGFMQDLIRGIKKLAKVDETRKPLKETAAVNSNINITPLLERVFMFLEDGDFARADEFCEQILNQDPKCAEAYVGKLMAELKVKKKEQLVDCAESFEKLNNYQKALRFGDNKLADELKGYVEHINERNESDRLSNLYNNAVEAMNLAKTEQDCKNAASKFREISGYKDADDLVKKCIRKSVACQKRAIYNSAKASMNGGTISDYESAIRELKKISGWKDADEQIDFCNRRITELKENAEKAAKKRKKIIAISTPIACVIIAFLIVLNAVIIPSGHYKEGIELLESGDYDKALAAFSAAGNYKDAVEKWAECLINQTHESISAGYLYTVGLKSDGTVVAVGDNGLNKCNVSGWKDIVAISAGTYHTVGLKSDRTVVATGNNNSGKCDVSDWKDIVAISAGDSHTVGLKSDGTVVATGNNNKGQCDVSDWKDIVAISAGSYHTVGLKSDGTVVATGDNNSGQCDVSTLKDIVAISAGSYHTVGLKSDRTVVATGNNYKGRCDVSDWADIVAISAGNIHTVGLKSDGSVVAVGNNDKSQCDVSGWKDIIAISAGDSHTVGLKSDGTVVAVGYNEYGQCDISGWKDIMIPSKNKHN